MPSVGPRATPDSSRAISLRSGAGRGVQIVINGLPKIARARITIYGRYRKTLYSDAVLVRAPAEGGRWLCRSRKTLSALMQVQPKLTHNVM